jgi:hypothetical protein
MVDTGCGIEPFVGYAMCSSVGHFCTGKKLMVMFDTGAF